MHAAKAGQSQVVTRLLAENNNLLKEENSSGDTAFFLALGSKSADLDTVKSLISETDMN